MGVPTSELRSGDRLLPTVLVSGLSLQQISKFLDPFVNSWMMFVNKHYGIQFEDPQGWKESGLQLMIVLGTGLVTWLHMRQIRKSDIVEEFSSNVGENKLEGNT